MQPQQVENINNTPANAVDVVVQKMNNIMRAALENPDESLNTFRTELNSILNSHTLSPNEAMTVLSRLISSIKMLAEYSRYQLLLNEVPGKNLMGKSYSDFNDPTDRKASIIASIINSFPSLVQELLQYPKKD